MALGLGTALAQGGASDTSISITVSGNEGNELVILVMCAVTSNSHGYVNSNITGITDSRGGGWANFAPYSGIGNVQTGDQPYISVIADSHIRISGAPLRSGDTITLNVNPGDAGAPDVAYVVHGFTGGTSFAANQYTGGATGYNNSDLKGWNSIPFGFPGYPGHYDSNLDTLGWATDVGTLPYPDVAAGYIAMAGSHGGNSWSPEFGTVVAEQSFGAAYIALVYEPLVAGSTPVEPGGSFFGGTVSLANYQFVSLLGGGGGGGAGGPSIFWFYKDGVWRNQNSDPDFSLYFYKDGAWRRHGTDMDFQLNGLLDETWQS